MSSLKDIMDVDVEPLESQAYRRTREAAQQQASLPLDTATPETPLPPTKHIVKGKTSSIKGRKSTRVSKPAAGQAIAPQQQSPTHRRSSAADEGMDFSGGFQAGGASQAGPSGSPQQSSRGSGSEPAMDVPVKYTPITGRVSKAKKGVPVHTCDICRPVKTFTRAEHLRRHQLSHQKPAYPCTFEDCERAFHRPDLLARHLHRHETQGEKPFKSEDPRSRGSSIGSETRSPLTVQPPSGEATSANQISPTDSLTPRTNGSGESTITASSFNTIIGSFQATDFGPTHGNSHKRSASEAQLGELEQFSTMSPALRGGRVPRNYDRMAEQGSFASTTQSPFENGYSERDASSFPYPTTPQLPLLRIPEETLIPALSYNNSPFCSSASESNYSTQSDGSRGGPHWARRGRSASIATLPDSTWSASATVWSSHGVSTAPQDMQSGPFDSIMGQYEPNYASPQVTPPPLTSRGQLLDVPVSFGDFYMESVGTPTLTTYNKPMAQRFSASPSRISNAGMGIGGRKKSVVESQLGTFATGTSCDSINLRQSQLDIYLSSYWNSFHPLFPILHQPTFDPSEETPLVSALQAIGTLYHNTPEARKKGTELNESCKKSIDLRLNWDLQTMQAILLTEIFTRFRGRKTNVRLSRQFEVLYMRLVSESNQGYTALYNQSPGTAASADSILDRFSGHETSSIGQDLSLEAEWYQWLTSEARQRLLSACFMFDVHQSMYHEQPHSKVHSTSTSLVRLPSPEELWNTRSASEWQSLRGSYPLSQPLHLIEHNISSDAVHTFSPFVQSLLTCWLTARFPLRGDPTFPNDFVPQSISQSIITLMDTFPTSPQAHAYLALYYCPLHDLLAVAGDTWVFSQKLTPPSAFHAAQSRLKAWSKTLTAAQATYHACQVLSSVLTREIYLPSEGVTPNPMCLSDYWSLYVSALICWAFGHKQQNHASSAESLARNNTSPLESAGSDDTPIFDGARHQAMEYCRNMLELGPEERLASKATMKGDTYGVIDAVRQCLELESVGDKCGMLVDAITVLSKIKKGRRGKWF